MTEADTPHTGQRGRIRRPAPPAPAPAPRTAPAAPREEPAAVLNRPPTDAAASRARSAVATAATSAEAEPDDGKASDSDVVRSTGSMAVATLISRITGFLRNALIGITLGPAVASAFNVANTLPNLITEIVLGAVLTSLVVPVLVRAQKEDPDGGAAFVRRLLTMSMTLLGVVTVAAVIGAPLLTRMMLANDGEVNVALSTAFATLLLPQIIFYGVFSLLMAVLNTKGVFKPGAWAPVANNVVAIATLLTYWLLPGTLSPDSPGVITDPHILLLGLGTTAGVVIQALIMLPPLRKAGIDLRPLWGIDDRIKQFGGMGLAIVAYVAISQLGYVATTKIASGADEAAPTIYQQAWLLLQVPYGIIGVALLTAIMPRLSRNAADGDDAAVVRDLSVATRLTMIALIPVIVFFTAFGEPIANGLFAYGAFPPHVADILGWTLSFSAFTLIPYALVLLHLRVFYAREEAWTPTFIIFGITVVKVALSLLAPLVASRTELVVVLLGAANGFGFIAGAIIGTWLLRRTLGNLRGSEVLRTCLWALGAALVGVAVAMALDSFILRGALEALGSIGALLRVGVSGVLFLVVTGLVLSRSPLPEVRTLGGFLARVPGLRRFAPKPDDELDSGDDAEAMATMGGPSAAAGENVAMASEGFTASPMLPPMPSEASRPTRFVPGEMVMGGRYRLLSEEGTRPGIRFWRASDRSAPSRTGDDGKPVYDEVALTFVDTTAAPCSGRMPIAAAVAVAENAKALRSIAGTGLARIRAVHLGRTDVVVAADWVPGVPLSHVGEDVNADAAAVAVADVADAAGRAHEAGIALGLDGLDRLRVGVDGRMVLAFPAPLPGCGGDEDLRVTCRALESLFDACHHVPADLSGILADAGRADPDEPDRNRGLVLAERLREAAFGPDSGQLRVIAEDADAPATPEPFKQVTGTPRRKLWSLGAVVVGAVLVLALVLAAVFAWLNRDADSPLTPDSVRRGPEAAEQALPGRPIRIADAAEWQATNPNPLSGPDDPTGAPLAIDGDENTAWTTSVYAAQLGAGPQSLKQGVGLALTFDGPAAPGTVDIVGSPGAVVEIRSLPDDLADAGTGPIGDTTVLGRATLGDGDTTITLDDAPKSRHLLIWVTRLPMPQAASIAEVTAAT